MAESGIYTVGGTVQAGGGLYISRKADDELLALCCASKFAYVLTARQMGKSSLMIRTAECLAEENIQSVIIDLTSVGIQVTVEAWYLGLLTIISDQLLLETNIVKWWNDRNYLGLTQRLTMFFQEILLAEINSPIVIFVDEIDTTLSLDFTDDFFAAIRYLYTARARKPEFKRLSFILIGVATPSDLIRDPTRTPFNIGQQVDLTDFTLQEALPLSEGLKLPQDESSKVMGWVLKWTGGHPYLTQRLCQTLVDTKQNTWAEVDVTQVVRDIFFGANSRKDNNLQFVRDMLTKRSPSQIDTLKTYQQIRQARHSVVDEEKSLIKSHLKLSGIICPDNQHILRVRNLIYRDIFDSKWIQQEISSLKPSIRRALSVSVLTTIVVVVAKTLSLLEPLELRAFDALIKSRPPEPMDERILIIGINEQDLRKYGYPVPDRTLANLLKKIQDYQPAVIGLDIYRDFSEEEELTSVFRASQNLIGISSNFHEISGPPGLLPYQIGFADILVDQDSYVRRVLLSETGSNTSSEYSFPFIISTYFLFKKEITFEFINNEKISFQGTNFSRIPSVFGGYFGIDARGHQIIFNPRNAQAPFAIKSMTDVLEGNISRKEIKNRVILLGITAASIQDNFFSNANDGITSDGTIKGVILQAHVVSQIISTVLDKRPSIWALTLWGDILWTFGWALIGGIIAWYFSKPWNILLISLALLLALYILCLIAITYTGLWLPLVPSVIVFLSVNSIVFSWSASTNVLNNRRKNSFEER